VGFESLCELVVGAVNAAGAALTVVAIPLAVEMKGVMVAMGFPIALTDTHGSRGLSVTECVRIPTTTVAKEGSPARGSAGTADAVFPKRSNATAKRLLAIVEHISCCLSRTAVSREEIFALREGSQRC
jgi:hypothetical protein